MTETNSHKPTVLFVCVHNAGRSQMAAAYLEHLSRGAIDVRSAGSRPAKEVNPAVVEAMAEDGIDISGRTTTQLTTEQLHDANMVITLGGGVDVPVIPGRKYEDWELTDPAGKDVGAVRVLRDDIKARVQSLVSGLLPALHPDAS